MSTVYILVLFLVICNTSSLEAVDKQNVTKREANGDFYPDWVPFKNKHGDELGEFVDVQKAKPKKRLAPPVNFLLKAVAEPQGDEYYDKGQGESDSEDYYEKKEWSDVHRPENVVEPVKMENHTQIADIEGIVNIITKPDTSPLSKVLNVQKDVTEEEENKSDSEYEEIKENENTKQDTQALEDKKEEPQIEETKNNEPKIEVKTKKPEKKDDEADYEENSSEKEKQQSQLSEEERKENEEKKAKILSSVDELKARHEAEQRFISEKDKQEEIFKEEHEREKNEQPRDAFDKYNDRSSRWKKINPDYDEYDDKDILEDKYHIEFQKRPITTTTLPPPPRTPKRKRKHKAVATGKLSVFKNPQLYTVRNDDEDEVTTTRPRYVKPAKRPSKAPQRFSSRYTAPKEKESERISLVPQNDSKEDEPALFFPKKRKNKRRFKIRTTEAPDSIADTNNIASDTTATDVAITSVGTIPTGTDTVPTGSDTLPSVSDTAPSALGSAPSASDTTPSGTDAVTKADVADSVIASTHKKEAKKNENFEHKRGGVKEHHSEHEEEHEEHGKKAYEGVHKDTKTKKGHHDREDHLDKYNDHGGVDKHHHEEDGHYGDHLHEEHGKKHAKYEESGKHSKGHSTKGSHDIHKKEEYEKKVEFFEEEGDSGEEEKHGGYNHEKEHSGGGHFKKGNLHAGHQGHDKGEKGHFVKGGHGHMHKGHRSSGGHDSHGKHGHAQFHKEGKEAGKKWIFHHGHPAKTANLVLIDRRAERYQHGPQYYG